MAPRVGCLLYLSALAVVALTSAFLLGLFL